VWFVRRSLRQPDEIWLCPFSDEYAAIVPAGEGPGPEGVQLPLRVLGVSDLKEQG
jgi:hypothetical protein